jgi:hypothetical protein
MATPRRSIATSRHGQHRRQRPIHGRSLTWLQRAGCAGAIAGVVALGLYARPEPPVVVTPGDAGICAALHVVAATALYDRLPPVDASPEMEEAVSILNADLSRVRTQIKEACRG